MLTTGDSSLARRTRCAAAFVAAVAVAATGTACDRQQTNTAHEFCAIMSDSVGLYVGNPVSQMGYEIGKVDAIEPHGTDVEVKFSIAADRPLPSDVKAVTRSPSILADRTLELVGNYGDGPKLSPATCIPRSRSYTPMSISQVIGSATDFVNGINPAGSNNIQDALRGIDQATHGNGTAINKLLTVSSDLLDNPDQAIADLGSVTRNLATLSSTFVNDREPLKKVLQDLPVLGPDLVKVSDGANDISHAIGEAITFIDDVELRLGSELQLALDTTSDVVRHGVEHYKGYMNLLNPLPRFISGLDREPPGAEIGGIAKHISDHYFYLLRWRPPLFRIRTPNGLALCGIMNASTPGSCADVQGTPYMVDTSLLQYVLTEAQHQ
jgi:phospholipid/cholesterol/gamma-HCH transport system substrate-binding protein